MPEVPESLPRRWLCPHCGYDWVPRVAKPVSCPECRKRLKE